MASIEKSVKISDNSYLELEEIRLLLLKKKLHLKKNEVLSYAITKLKALLGGANNGKD